MYLGGVFEEEETLEEPPEEVGIKLRFISFGNILLNIETTKPL